MCQDLKLRTGLRSRVKRGCLNVPGPEEIKFIELAALKVCAASPHAYVDVPVVSSFLRINDGLNSTAIDLSLVLSLALLSPEITSKFRKQFLLDISI